MDGVTIRRVSTNQGLNMKFIHNTKVYSIDEYDVYRLPISKIVYVSFNVLNDKGTVVPNRNSRDGRYTLKIESVELPAKANIEYLMKLHFVKSAVVPDRVQLKRELTEASKSAKVHLGRYIRNNNLITYTNKKITNTDYIDDIMVFTINSVTTINYSVVTPNGNTSTTVNKSKVLDKEPKMLDILNIISESI
jgi:hypothetical protein